MRKTLPIALALIAIVACPLIAKAAGAYARRVAPHHQPQPLARVVTDVLVVRPVGAAGLVLGTAGTIVAIPVAVPSGNMNKVSDTLVRKPYDFTFRRPLGVW